MGVKDSDEPDDFVVEKKPLAFSLSKDLSKGQTEEMKTLLKQYEQCFQPQTGQAKCEPHRIVLKNDAQPLKQRQYRIPLGQQEIVKKQVQEMLGGKVIRPSESPWSSPVLLAKKKSGEWRFCIDFRKINEMTKRDVYPLPRINDLLDMLKGAKFFSSIDLASGYWQVPLAEESKEVTLFRTANGHYEFNVLPFGLTNAPAMFQRMMDQVLNDKIGHGVLVYLDDVLIFGNSFEEHQRNLKDVLTLLNKRNLKCKADKCFFGIKTIRFLGHIVNTEGIGPDPDKIKAI